MQTSSTSTVIGSMRKVIDDPVVGLKYLCIAAVAYIIIQNLPYGDYVLYPFTIFATFYHEMGHGLCAMLVGFNFMQLTIYPSGSGFALYSFTTTTSTPLRHFLVSFSGPMGPSYVGALLLCLSATTYRISRATLFIFGFLLVIVSVLVVRGTWFGVLFIPTAGLIILFIAFKFSDPVIAFVVQFLGVQACCAAYQDIPYFFTYNISTDPNQTKLSDTGAMQQALLLPHYVWAVVILAFSALLFAMSLFVVLWRSWSRRKETQASYELVHEQNNTTNDDVIDFGHDMQLQDFEAKLEEQVELMLLEEEVSEEQKV
jgi:hypothetical protein